MVSRAFHFVYREIKGLHQAAYVLALFAFGSQMLAIVRDRLLAHTFGAGIELDLYYTAFRIPDLLFVLFAAVLSVYVLLPFIERSGSMEAKRNLLSQVFTLFLLVYTALAVVLAATAPWFVPYLFPGYVEQADVLVPLVQILLLQPLLLGISSVCGVVTQMHHRFVLYAISPLLYNVGIIFGLIALYPFFGLEGLAAGVVIGAAGHLLIQVPFVRTSGCSFTALFTFDWAQVRSMVVAAMPRALTLSLNQLVFLLFISVATTLTVGSVSVFQFAYNIQSVPLAIIGMSYSVAAFPTLSHLFAKRDQAAFNLQLMTALRHILFWSIPIIGLVVVLRAHIVRVLLGSGEFDWSDTRLTAAVLAVFIVSLFAQAVQLLFVRAFYAGGKTLIPLYITVASSAVAVSSAFVGLWYWQNNTVLQTLVANTFRLDSVPGAEILVLAAAFTFGQMLQIILLLVVARISFGVGLRPLIRLLVQSVSAMSAGAAATYLTLQTVVEGVNQDMFMGIALQGGTAAAAGVVAICLVYWLLGSDELRETTTSFRKRLFKTDVIKPQ
jgi:putative peptidoglycan lipid II flippase